MSLIKIREKMPGNLWLGNRKDAVNKKFLRANNIGVIISVDWQPRDPNFKYVGQYFWEPMLDSIKEADSAEYPTKVLKLIGLIRKNINSGKNVLIHCAAGKSRSASIVIAYLSHEYNMSIDQALLCCKYSRPEIDPDTAFIARLGEMKIRGQL